MRNCHNLSLVLTTSVLIFLMLVSMTFGETTSKMELGTGQTALENKRDAETGKKRIICTNDINVKTHNHISLTRRKRYTYQKYGDGTPSIWDSNRVTWAIVTPSRKISVGQQRRIIRQALDKWSAVTPLDFFEVSTSTRQVPDVKIIFARGQHGPPPDDPVFDGPAIPGRPNSLGHAWGPGPDRAGLNGDVHFDEDDDWTDETRFLGVAIHELGHSLGLTHSKDPEAIMFPAYAERAELGQDDIRGAQFLYGRRGGPPRPRPRTTHRPVVHTRHTRPPRPNPNYRFRTTPAPVTTTTLRPDSPCLLRNFDAIVQDPFVNGMGYFIIMEDRVHHIMYDGTPSATFSYEQLFPGTPTRPDVMFGLPEKHTMVIIKDNKMWQFVQEGLVDDKPISLEHLRFPEKPRSAVTLSDVEGKRRIYLLGERYWWNLDLDFQVSTTHYTIDSFSRDLPRQMLVAAQLEDHTLYAITKDSYVEIDLRRRSRTHADHSTLSGRPDWLSKFCQSSSSRIEIASSTLALVLVGVLFFKSLWH